MLGSPQLPLAGEGLCPQPLVQALCFPTQVFKWTGRNNFFLKGDMDLLMIGAGR